MTAMKRRLLWIVVTVFILILGVVGYDVSRLQTGFESPSPALIEQANLMVANQPDVPNIGSYDSFEVPVEDGIGVTVYVRESDTAVANILMIHGAAGGAWVWEYYLATFPNEFNLYAMSWRGHFDSSPVDDANSADYVLDQTAVLSAIQGRNALPVHLIGHSFGGATAVLQTAGMVDQVASIHLLGAVVPLQYSPIQRQIVPRLLPPIILQAAGEDGQGASPFPDMFIATDRMKAYQIEHASQPYSVEKPGLMPGDAFAVAWQEELDVAYRTVAQSDVPVWMIIARYDNVVKPADSREMAARLGVTAVQLESGHYIQLDLQALESAKLILNNLISLVDESLGE